MDPQSIAQIVAATLAAMKPVEAPRAPPAAAPSAPSSHPMSGMGSQNDGLVDIFQPGVAQRLGPKGIRGALEAAWNRANELSGAPARPKPPGQGGK
jgi:hypothetical protein